MDRTTTWFVRGACAAIFCYLMWLSAVTAVTSILSANQRAAQCEQTLRSK